MKIPFSPPYIDDIVNEVVSSLKSGWITTGPKVKELEYSTEPRSLQITRVLEFILTFFLKPWVK